MYGACKVYNCFCAAASPFKHFFMSCFSSFIRVFSQVDTTHFSTVAFIKEKNYCFNGNGEIGKTDEAGNEQGTSLMPG